MNKHILRFIYGISLMLLFTGGGNNLSASVQTLKYTDHEPLGGMRTRFINDVFFSAIEKESKGRLKVEAHWDGELSNGYNALRLVGAGAVADIGIVVPEYTADTLTLHQIFKSFPTGPSGDAQVAFFQRVYAEIPDFSDELSKANVVNLLCCTGYPVAFFSTRALENLNDIRGGKWRTASFWHRDFLRNVGANPVTMPWGEGVRDALKDGALDGLMVNIDSGDDIKAQAAAPHVLASPGLWLGHVYILAINKNTWAKLSKEDKEAIQRAAAVAYKTLGVTMRDSFTTMMERMEKDGAKIRLLEPAELKQWETATKYQQLQAAWVKEQESKGVQNAGAVLEKVSAVMNEIMK